MDGCDGAGELVRRAESIGVRKSYEAAADSDLALLVLDGSQDMTAEDHDLLTRLSGLGKLVVVVNKCDLSLRLGPENLQQELAQTTLMPAPAGRDHGRDDRGGHPDAHFLDLLHWQMKAAAAGAGFNLFIS